MGCFSPVSPLGCVVARRSRGLGDDTLASDCRLTLSVLIEDLALLPDIGVDPAIVGVPDLEYGDDARPVG